MHWYARYKSHFFTAWTKAGLPSPEIYERIYTTRLQAIKYIHYTNNLPETKSESPDPLNPKILNSVYGFGVLVGEICGILLGLYPEQMQERLDWCGQFNLGISLFDYLCDEVGIESALATLPESFPLFTHSKTESVLSQGVHYELKKLISIILDRLTQEIGVPSSSRRRFGLWRALEKMFQAEQLVATVPLSEEVSFSELRNALYFKSVEPFRVISEWVARDSQMPQRTARVRQARKLGRAIGLCYCLTDDANDVWRDLSAGRWNLFLLSAVEYSPGLFSNPPDIFLEIQLNKIWESHALIERMTQSAVQGLIKILAEIDATEQRKQDALGLVAVSLARW